LILQSYFIHLRNPLIVTLFMSHKNSDKLIEQLQEKKKQYSVRVTTRLSGCKLTSYINGSNKNHFIDDCIRREFNESRMLRYIIDTYYSVVSNQPELNNLTPNEIKQFIIDKIKF